MTSLESVFHFTREYNSLGSAVSWATLIESIDCQRIFCWVAHLNHYIWIQNVATTKIWWQSYRREWDIGGTSGAWASFPAKVKDKTLNVKLKEQTSSAVHTFTAIQTFWDVIIAEPKPNELLKHRPKTNINTTTRRRCECTCTPSGQRHIHFVWLRISYRRRYLLQFISFIPFGLSASRLLFYLLPAVKASCVHNQLECISVVCVAHFIHIALHVSSQRTREQARERERGEDVEEPIRIIIFCVKIDCFFLN